MPPADVPAGATVACHCSPAVTCRRAESRATAERGREREREIGWFVLLMCTHVYVLDLERDRCLCRFVLLRCVHEYVFGLQRERERDVCMLVCVVHDKLCMYLV